MVNPACSSPAQEAANHGRVRSPARGRRVRAWVIGCLIAVSVAACASKPKGPPPPTPEQQAAARRQQEQQEADRIAAEQDALARRAEEQERQKKAAAEAKLLPSEFGTPAPLVDVTPVAPATEPAESGAAPGAGETATAPASPQVPGVAAVAPVYVPQKMPPLTVPGAEPYDKAFPPARDHLLRVGIVSDASQAQAGQGLARMLSQEERKYMEDTLGLGIRVAYVTETSEPPPRRTRIGYRPGFLKAAVHIAALLPQPQQVVAMSESDAARHNVDVLVRIGTDLR